MGSPAGGIVAGTARVIITGDYSTLASSFQRAQGIAATGSAAIASSVGTAFGASSGLVDQFGRAIVSSTAKVTEAVPPVLDLEAGVQRLALAQAILAQNIENANTASGHQVSQLQATSGAIRVALGEQSIRAAERFLSLIPGIGAALQVAFPVIGALALGEAVLRATQNVIGLKAAEEELQKATEAADKAQEKLGRTLDQNTAQHVTREFGPAAGDVARAAELERLAKAARTNFDDLSDDVRAEVQEDETVFNRFLLGIPLIGSHVQAAAIDRLKAIGEQIKQTRTDIEEMTAQAADLREQAAKAKLEEGGQIGAARASAGLEAIQRQGEASRTAAKERIDQALRIREVEIDAIDDSTERAIEAAQAKLQAVRDSEAAITGILRTEVPKRIALERQRSAAEAAGKDAPEQARIAIDTAAKIAGFQAEAEKERAAAHSETVRAEIEADATYVTQSRELVQSATKAWEEYAGKRKSAADQTFEVAALKDAFNDEAQARAAGITARGAGEQRALEIEGQKIELENRYAGLVVQTAATKIDLLEREKALDEEARQAKLDGVKADLADAEAIATAAQGTEAYVGALEKVARLKNQVANIDQQNRNASAKEQGGIDQAKRQTDVGFQIGRDISDTLQKNLPQDLGRALASGVFGGGKRGEDIGRQVGDALKNAGKNLLGDVFTATMHQLVAAMVTNTAVTGANTGATVSNVAATTTHAATMVAHGIVVGANTIGIIANTIATELNTIVTAIKGFFGFAEGGTPPVGVPSLVGEKGPELFVPRQLGTIIPAGAFSLEGARSLNFGNASTTLAHSDTFNSSKADWTINLGGVHLHGVQSPEVLMRQIADRVKTAWPGASKFSK